MENNREIMELLRKMEENSRKQLLANRVLCILLLACTGCCVLLAVRLMGVLPQVSGLMTQLEGVLRNLETTTDQLARLDLQGMVADVDSLVDSARQTMESIGSINFQTLNRAIEDLSAVIEPLARWFR